MNILLIGSGGREHALAWKIAQSPLLKHLFIAPGNAGMADVGTVVVLDVENHKAVIDFCRVQNVSLVVVGPEAPLVAGLVDDLRAAGIRAFGPTKAAAQLEGSKAFTKALCMEAHIPTAQYAHFDNLDDAKAYVNAKGAPIVVKADGLAAGKGVVVAMTKAEALNALEMMFDGALGAAGHTVVIEEFMEGEEVSFFALSDGESVLALTSAQDHKRVFDGDKGPNTGGMGAYSPASIFTPELEQQVLKRILLPTIRTMKARGTPYTGVLYAGLILTKDGPKLIEYNARFGDPETQVLMMRLKSDVVPLLMASSDKTLHKVHAEWKKQVALTVVMAAKGYPGDYAKGSSIRGVPQANALEGCTVFHAGTKRNGEQLVSNGGRVLNVSALAATATKAKLRAYEAVALIEWPEGFCRTDIGQREVDRESA